jgi:CubicO group peptidase (beta-lactamase class C family)
MRLLRRRRLNLVLAALIVLVMGCSPSSEPTTSRTPSASALSALGQALDDYIANGSVNLRSIRAIVVSQNDKIVVEKYYHGGASDYTEIGSVAKSLTSTLVGIALTDRTIPSLDSTLAELLPQHRSTMKASSARITVRQLLTMTAGWNEENQGIDIRAKNLVGRVLAEGPGAAPGSGWSFHDANAQLLAAVIAERTGMTVLDYARKRLFDPLGISTRPAYEGRIADIDSPEVGAVNSFMWLRDPDGRHVGYFGVKLTPLDMLKIGQLYLNGGTWEGQRILSEDYVQQATTAQVKDVGSRYGYGYQWWIPPLSIDRPAFFARGKYGQYITVVPELKLNVVVVAEPIDPDPTFEDHLALVDTVIIPRTS